MSMGKYAVAGLVVAVSLVGCNQTGFRSAEPPAAPAAKAPSVVTEVIIPVQVERPVRRDISSYLITTSRVEAERRVQVVAEGMGECRKVHVEEGDYVKPGQVLAELATDDVLATIGQTEVQVRQTRTVYQIAEDSLKLGIGSKAERDNAKFSYEQAMATLNMHKVQLEKLTVRSPISGVITKRNVQLGQVVSIGAPLFQIVDPDSFILSINPPERELSRLQLGQVAKVAIDAVGEREFEAKVLRVNPAIDAASGTFKVVLEFAAEVRKLLREAAFARVQLVTDTHKDALLLPKDAVVEENARKYLFVVEEGEKAEALVEEEAALTTDDATGAEKSAAPAEEKKDARPHQIATRIEVETGLEDSNYVEILSEVAEDAQVVVLGQHTLKSGSKVTVMKTGDAIRSKLGMGADEALKEAKEHGANEPKKAGRSRQRHP